MLAFFLQALIGQAFRGIIEMESARALTKNELLIVWLTNMKTSLIFLPPIAEGRSLGSLSTVDF